MGYPYYESDDLAEFDRVGDYAGELYDGYDAWYQKTMAEGALPSKIKELIACAVAHAVQCPYCIDAHTKGAYNKGATKDEIMEAIHVASVIRGGASLVHGVQALRALEEE